MSASWRNRGVVLLAGVVVAAGMSGCGYRGLNTFELPGVKGHGAGSFQITAQLPDVRNLQANARVRVDDIPVGNVDKIVLQGWHALLTMHLDSDVNMPANSIVTIGQPTLLGAPDIELTKPKKEPARGKLRNGSLIPLAHAGKYPTVEETLSSVALVLNGGGLGAVQDITDALGTAFKGRENDLRSLLAQLDTFTSNLETQTTDAIAASDSFNRVLGKFADQQPVLDRAIKAIPDALAVLNDERSKVVEAVDKLGKFSGLANDTVNASRENLVKVLNDVGPITESLANVGPRLAYGAIGLLFTYPFPTETVEKYMRGETANITAIIDLTLSRLDLALFTGTRFECNLTALELDWGRTVGQFPSPCINPGKFGRSNPLSIPYNDNQGS